MFGSEALEVAIGVSLFFLITSLICSAIREAFEGLLKTRAKHLERGIRELLDDPTGETLTKSLFEHGQIFSLFSGSYDPSSVRFNLANVTKPAQIFHFWRARRRLPSYIPAGQFASALMDIVMRGPGNWPYPVPSEPMTVDRLRERAAVLPSGRLQRAILAAADFGENDLAKVKANLERWFDGSMDRVSGWYKRTTQMWLFLIGLVVAIGMNLDALTITRTLVQDKAIRDAFVAEAEAVQAAGRDAAIAPRPVAEIRRELAELGAPVGWTDGRPAQMCTAPAGGTGSAAAQPGCVDQALWIALGWLLTAIAVMFGAPFWFDVLNKFMVIRSTVKPREKSPEEASEDRQQRPQAPSGGIGGTGTAGGSATVGTGGGGNGGTGGGGTSGAAGGGTGGGTTSGGAAANVVSTAQLAADEAGFEPESWQPGRAPSQEKPL